MRTNKNKSKGGRNKIEKTHSIRYTRGEINKTELNEKANSLTDYQDVLKIIQDYKKLIQESTLKKFKETRGLNKIA